MNDLKFFDCNVSFGLPSVRPLTPVETVDALLAAMDHAGVAKALVWHNAQLDVGPHVGNSVVAQAIAEHPRLVGAWTILPNQTREFGTLTAFFGEMRTNRIGALRVFPDDHKFLLNEVAMGDWLAEMQTCHIPLIVSTKKGCQWRDLYAVLADFPELTCIVCDHGCWGEDRLFRPLIERYPNVYVDTAYYLLDGGIEAFVSDYGATRMVFGSDFPHAYFGGMMMAIKHADIPLAAKQLIAGGNLERILAEVVL